MFSPTRHKLETNEILSFSKSTNAFEVSQKSDSLCSLTHYLSKVWRYLFHPDTRIKNIFEKAHQQGLEEIEQYSGNEDRALAICTLKENLNTLNNAINLHNQRRIFQFLVSHRWIGIHINFSEIIGSIDQLKDDCLKKEEKIVSISRISAEESLSKNEVENGFSNSSRFNITNDEISTEVESSQQTHQNERQNLAKQIKGLSIFEYFTEEEVEISTFEQSGFLFQDKALLLEYASTILSIPNLETKKEILKEILSTGNWENECLEERLSPEEAKKYPIEDDYNIENGGSWNFAMPFVALFALSKGEITQNQFIQIQIYFSLRLQFPKEKIEIVKPPELCAENSDRWEELLKDSLTNYVASAHIQHMSAVEFSAYVKMLREVNKETPGELVYFSFLSPRKIGYNETIYTRIRDTGFRIFCWNRPSRDPKLRRRSNEMEKDLTGNIAAPPCFYQKALEIFFPDSYVNLEPKIGLSPVEAQYKRMGTAEKKGQCDLLIPFPGRFVEMADSFPAPGIEGMLHDIYHAFLVSAVPHDDRAFFLNSAKDLLESRSLPEELQKELKKEIERRSENNIINQFGNFIYDMEVPGTVATKVYYKNGSRQPNYSKKSDISNTLAILEKGKAFNNSNYVEGHYFYYLANLSEAPWNIIT